MAFQLWRTVTKLKGTVRKDSRKVEKSQSRISKRNEVIMLLNSLNLLVIDEICFHLRNWISSWTASKAKSGAQHLFQDFLPIIVL